MGRNKADGSGPAPLPETPLERPTGEAEDTGGFEAASCLVMVA